MTILRRFGRQFVRQFFSRQSVMFACQVIASIELLRAFGWPVATATFVAFEYVGLGFDRITDAVRRSDD